MLTTPALTWLFGVPADGVYTVMSAAVTLLQGTVDVAMVSVMQRVVPQAKDEAEALSAVKWALIIGTLPSVLIAIVVTALAGRMRCWSTPRPPTGPTSRSRSRSGCSPGRCRSTT